MSTVRKYSDDVPPYLRERPKFFATHCIKRLASASCLIATVTDTADDIFTVPASDDTDKSYTVRMHSVLDADAPSCECVDWQRHFLPCKHMMAVISSLGEDGWRRLPEQYRALPQFNIDQTLTNNDMTSTDTPQVTARSSEPIEPSSDAESTVSQWQSRVRQAMTVIMNYTYMVSDVNFLQASHKLLSTQVLNYKNHVDKSLSAARFRRHRCLKHRKSIRGSKLHRRLTAIRQRHRRRQLRRKTCAKGIHLIGNGYNFS